MCFPRIRSVLPPARSVVAGCALPLWVLLSILVSWAALASPPHLRADSPQVEAPAAPGASPSTEREELPADALAATGRWLLFPEEPLYPSYVADPQRLVFSLGVLTALDEGIADTGSTRFQLRVGGRFGVLRSRPDRPDARRWQFDFEAGMDGQFDTSESLDNVGWDGNFGFTATSASPSSPWSWRLGFFHTSAHIGDELIERTGRRRLGYTRNELVAGLSRAVSERGRGYAEVGWGSDDEESGQDPARAQLGWVWEAPGTLWAGRMGWYWAFDFQGWEERDWRVDSAFQIGLMMPTEDNVWRLGLALADGRPSMGEFFRDTETWATVGVWLDL